MRNIRRRRDVWRLRSHQLPRTVLYCAALLLPAAVPAAALPAAGEVLLPGERAVLPGDQTVVPGERTVLPGELTALPADARPQVSPQQPAGLPQDATLDDLLRYARQHSPGILAAARLRDAAAELPAQAGALGDPSLTATLPALGSTARLGVAQMFPWPGTRSLRAAQATEASLAARSEYNAAELAVFRGVITAYAELVYLEQAVEATSLHLQLARQIEAVALEQFRAGERPYADVLRSQIEVAGLENDVLALQDLLPVVGAQLNAVLGRPGGAPLPLARPVPARDIRLDAETLLAELPRTNPELQAMRHEIAAAERGVELAGRERLPGLMLGAEYMRDGRMDGLGLMLGISLPVRRQRILAGEREAQARFLAAGELLRHRQLELDAEARMALFAFRDAERKIALYGATLIPIAEQALAATETAYRAGAAEFVSLVDARRVRLDFELVLARSLADRTQRLAELEMLVGRPLGGPEEPDADAAVALAVEPDAADADAAGTLSGRPTGRPGDTELGARRE